MQTPFEARATAALAETPVFSELGLRDLRWIHRRSVRKGESLFEKSDPSEHLFGLVSGQVKLFVDSADGRQISLSLVGPGGLVGEAGVVEGGGRSMNATALAHSELAAIHRGDLETLMSRHVQLRDSLARACASAVRNLTERVEDAAFLSIEMRIEKALRDLAARIGESTGQGTRIPLRQRDLADLLGTSRESVNKVLTSPAMRGKVELSRGAIVWLGV